MKMPEWHKDIRPDALIQWCGHWFTFEGIDPDHDPDMMFLRYKGPTKQTKRRQDATRSKPDADA